MKQISRIRTNILYKFTYCQRITYMVQYPHQPINKKNQKQKYLTPLPEEPCPIPQTLHSNINIPTGSSTRQVHTSCNMPTTPWIGTHGAKKRCRRHSRRTNPSCSVLATLPATGAMSWSANLSRMKTSLA